MLTKIITLLSDKLVIKIVVEILDYLAQKSSNKLDDKLVKMVRKRLLEEESESK